MDMGYVTEWLCGSGGAVRTVSGTFPLVGFDMNGVEPSRSATAAQFISKS
jgi:hypothetical protein